MSERELAAWQMLQREIAKTRPDELRAEADRMAEVIRTLKASSNPAGETLLLSELSRLRHPDIPALLKAIDDRRKGEGGKGRVKAGDL